MILIKQEFTQFNIQLVITKSVYSYGDTDIIMLLYKSNSRNYASTAVLLAMAWSSVARCRIVFLVPICPDSSKLVPICSDSLALVPKCLTDIHPIN